MDQFSREHIEHVEGRLARLERKLDFVLQQLKLEYPDEATAAIKDLLKKGKKAEAVKFYVQEKGGSLTEATAAVEKIARSM